MAAIDQLVKIQITQATSAVAQASFSIPIIMGTTAPGWPTADRVHTYTSPAAMLSDGFLSTSPEYIYASAMYAQTVTPTVFKVGKRTAGANQVDALTVNNLTVGHQYTLTVNGSAFSYTAVSGDTQQAVLTALKTAMSGASWYNAGTVTGTGTSATLALTFNGAGVYNALDSFLTATTTTPGGGLAGDLALAAAYDNSWYGVVAPGATDSDILNAALWVEANKKLFVAASSTAAVATTSTSDVASQLKSAAYARTALAYVPASINQGMTAAWAASQLALTPGSTNWAFKNLAGITADSLTDNQVGILIGSPTAGVVGKNVNIYQQVGGVNITQMGTGASGQFIDITVGLDWLQSTMQTNIYRALTQAGKIPYTDIGLAVIQAQVQAALQLGVSNGLIDGDSPITINAPKAASVPANLRAMRTAPTITFTCRLQGALNAVLVAGTVSV